MPCKGTPGDSRSFVQEAAFDVTGCRFFENTTPARVAIHAMQVQVALLQ
jgi:hypothetical protein